MAKNKEQMLKRCRSGNDFRKVAKKFGANVWEAKKHTVAETNLGRTHIPRHPGDLRKGTRFSIFNALMVILPVLGGIIYWFLEVGKNLPPTP